MVLGKIMLSYHSKNMRNMLKYLGGMKYEMYINEQKYRSFDSRI